ncbi:MAG: XRE family transcriptional regulator [Coriobacteriia bacterium]|nr:XRE family transcriptional regulator [Coriobacteriia bacterium]
MNIAQNIKRRRLEVGMSQQDLADALGYKSRSTIAKIEAGENDIPLSKLLDLSRALDTSIESLLTGSRPVLSPAEEGSASRPVGHGRTAAVILAGGKSTRNLQNIPNQFINVLGKPVISYCLDVYQNHPLIDDIYIVCLDQWESILLGYAQKSGITKLRGIIPAGDSGIRSVLNGLRRLRDDGFTNRDLVVLQESTRPFVTEDMISKLLTTCKAKGHAIIGESKMDNVQFLVDGQKTTYIDRSRVVDLQSPDAYTLDTLDEVFAKARRQNHPLRESCVGLLMSSLGYDLNFCEGNHNNIKIVRQEDIAIFTALVKQRD